MIKRVSGIAMASVAALLAISGYALYYTTDGLHNVSALVHETIGVSAVLFALTHWRRHRTARRSRLLPG